MLLSVTLKRQVFSNCQNTVRWFVVLSPNEEQGAVSAKSFCFKEVYPYYTKILTGIISEWEWKFFLLPLPLFPNVPSWDVWGWKKIASIPSPWYTGWLSLLPSPTPRDMSSAWLGSSKLCVQMKCLLFTYTQLRSRTGWHNVHNPRALGLTNGKTNQESRTPWEKLAAKLQANLREGNWCQLWTHQLAPDATAEWTHQLILLL